MTWEVLVPHIGTVTDLWGASYTTVNGVITATGLSWNATLAPGASTDFGFCANK